MERPDITKDGIEKDLISPVTGERLVARTQSIEEANKVAEQYEMQGYSSRIEKKSQGSLALYEVWVSKRIQRM
jgi:hypothetical protein